MAKLIEGKIDNVVRSSEPDWLERAIGFYKDKVPFVFIDDASLGLTQSDLESAVSLLKAARHKAHIPWKTITAVLTGLGLSGVGIWMVAAAIIDPEPTSKLWLLVAGGIMLTLTGGMSTLSALGVKFTITGKGGGGSEFRIEPKE